MPLWVIASAAVLIAASNNAQVQSQSAPMMAAKAVSDGRYSAYESLIGDWYSEENGVRMRQSLSWGPARSYIRYATYMRQPGGEEKLHFDGIMVWNGRTRQLDFLFAVEPGSGVQEKGTVRAEQDGSWLREVELTDARGSVVQFRQTIRMTGADAAVTSLMRRTAEGWVPSFPGADSIEMRRGP